MIVAHVAPYPTDTELLRTLIGADAAGRQARPEDSVAGLSRGLAGLTLESSATPRRADGKPMPW